MRVSFGHRDRLLFWWVNMHPQIWLTPMQMHKMLSETWMNIQRFGVALATFEARQFFKCVLFPMIKKGERTTRVFSSKFFDSGEIMHMSTNAKGNFPRHARCTAVCILLTRDEIAHGPRDVTGFTPKPHNLGIVLLLVVNLNHVHD